MKITMDNYAQAKFDTFSMFNDRWALLTAGGPDKFNTMTIGWGTLGTIWGPPKKGKQIVTVFVRENRKTHEILKGSDHFTVCFFPEENRKDLGKMGSISGNDDPDKLSKTDLTVKPLDNAIGYEQATLTFVCRKIYSHRFDIKDVPEDIASTMYADGNPIHYMYMGEIENVFGEMD